MKCKVTTEKPVTREDRMRDTLPSQENGNPISIELEDVETPRSSMDLGHLSRRSSMDSLASSVHPFQNRQSQLTGPRLSQILLRSSSSPALAKKPEHLLWGFAQVVGNFIVDPTLINNNEFAPLKRRTMYRPHGAGIGGGGGLMMGKPDAQSKIGTSVHMFSKVLRNLNEHVECRYPYYARDINTAIHFVRGPRSSPWRNKEM